MTKQHIHQENIDPESIEIEDDYEVKKIYDEPILSQMPDFFKRARLIGVGHVLKTLLFNICLGWVLNFNLSIPA